MGDQPLDEVRDNKAYPFLGWMVVLGVVLSLWGSPWGMTRHLPLLLVCSSRLPHHHPLLVYVHI